MVNIGNLFTRGRLQQATLQHSAWLARAAFVSFVATCVATGCGDDDQVDGDGSGGAEPGHAGVRRATM